MRIEITNREALGLLWAATTACYASPLLLDASLSWEFLSTWDDSHNFIDNPVIHALSWSNLVQMLTLRRINVYEPLGWLLKAVVYHFAGPDSRAVRLITLGLHIAVSIVLAHTSALLIQLLQYPRAPLRYTMRQKIQWKRDYTVGCFISALIFLVHPICVEVVGWPSAQPYALAALFSGLALYRHCIMLQRRLGDTVHLSEDPSITRTASQDQEGELESVFNHAFQQHLEACMPHLTDRDQLIALGWYVCAVLSKSVSVLLPVTVILIDALIVLPHAVKRYPVHAQLSLREYLEPLARYILSQALWLFTLLVFIVTTVHFNRDGTHEDADVLTLTLHERLVKAVSAPVWVLRHIIWPVDLRPHYQLRDHELQLWGNAECLLSALVLCLAIWWYFFESDHTPGSYPWRLISLGGLIYFCAMLLPTCGLVQHGMVSKGADRYAYFPLMVAVPITGYWLTEWLRLEMEKEGNQIEVATRGGAVERSQQRVFTTDHSPRPPPEIHTAHEYVKPVDDKVHDPSHAVKQRRAVVAIVVFALLTLSRRQFSVWANDDTLTAYSIAMDPHDWRLLDLRATRISESPPGCGDNFERCRELWQLAHLYAPTHSLKAQLFRLKIEFLLGERQQACEAYMALLASHPHSCAVQNNAGICLFMAGHTTKVRQRFVDAQSTVGYEAVHSVAADNLLRFDEWKELSMQQRQNSNNSSTEHKPIFFGRIMW